MILIDETYDELLGFVKDVVALFVAVFFTFLIFLILVLLIVVIIRVKMNAMLSTSTNFHH